MPHLVTVTGNRIPLRHGNAYVLGRGKDCDVVVEDAACSRHHARVAVSPTGDAAFVEDLESRNGTYLAGERIHSRSLAREGSRIQVGATVFLVRLAESQEDLDLAETGTVAFDQTTAAGDLDGGELARHGLVEILNHCFSARRSVTLHVALPDGHGRVEIRDGNVHTAEYAGLRGFNALVRLARQPTGIFWMAETTEACTRRIQEHGVRLLADLARCLDPAAAS